MPNTSLSLSLQANAEGDGSLERVSPTLDKIAASADKAGKSIQGIAGSSSRDIQTFTGEIAKASAELIAFGAAHKLAIQSMESYSAATIRSGSATETLLNGYRALRLAFSPTVFTAATIGVGILAEKTIELVNARGKLIEQQALMAATTGKSISGIDAIHTSAVLSGSSERVLQRLVDASKAAKGTADYAKGLSTLGMSQGQADAMQWTGYLGAIAESFRSIKDPVDRATLSVQLFGKENAGLALSTLDGTFASSVRAIDTWGLTLSDVSRSRISDFRRDIRNLDDDIRSIEVDFRAAGEKIKQALEVGGADVYAWSKSGLSAIGQTMGGAHREFIEGAYGAPNDVVSPGAVMGYLTGAPVISAEAQRALENANVGAQSSIATSTQSGVTSTLERGVLLSMAADARSRAAIEADLSRQRERLAKSAEAIRGGDHSIEQYAEYQGASQAVARGTSQIQGIDIARRQNEALRQSRELLFRSQFDPTTGRDIRSEIDRATTYTDDDGNLQKFKLLDEARRNLEAGFHAYVLSFQEAASDNAIKDIESEYKLAVKYDADLARKQREYPTETARIGTETIRAAFANQTSVLGYNRDAALRANEFSSITPARTIRPDGMDADDYQRQREVMEANASVSSIRNRSSIEQNYVTKKALADAASIEREQQSALIGVATALAAGQITRSQAADRYSAISESGGQQGSALNDQYAADLLKVQQQAVIDTTQVLKNLEDQQVARI